MRPHQWAKNLLIFVPLLLSHSVAIASLLIALLAFCCFSLTASATYIVNDLLDIESDRRHPQKQLRPFASGNLSAFAGIGVSRWPFCSWPSAAPARFRSVLWHGCFSTSP